MSVRELLLAELDRRGLVDAAAELRDEPGLPGWAYSLAVDYGLTLEPPKRRGRNRPPLRVCPGCGKTIRAWQDGAPCTTCARDAKPDTVALADEIRTGRLERGAERE